MRPDDDLRSASSSLLVAGEQDPAIVENLGGLSPIVLLGDHAGRAIPRALGDLGLCAEDLRRHIAWDIGAAGLGAELARRLDAPFIHQRYSRLVIDCNRDPAAESAMPTISDGSIIPGNQRLGPEDRAARVRAVFTPYHDRIASVLDKRRAEGRASVLVSVHSFTPSMGGQARPWRFGVLHRGDSALSRAVLAGLTAVWGGDVGDNQPYAMDGTDFTIPHHADRLGLDYLELEVRQDLIATETDQAQIARRLSPILQDALSEL